MTEITARAVAAQIVAESAPEARALLLSEAPAHLQPMIRSMVKIHWERQPGLDKPPPTGEIIANSTDTLAEAHRVLDSQYEQHHYIRITLKTGKQRSPKQNNALHVYCRLLADELNAAGHDMRRTLKEGVEIAWTMETVKNHLWRPIQEALTDKHSTAEPERSDYSEIYETLNRHTAQKLGVSVAWPCDANSGG